MTRVGMHEAKTKLSHLVERAEAGEDVIIQRNGIPVARLVPIPEAERTIGSLHGIFKGQIHMSDDFDELPDDIARAFEMR